MIRFAEQAELEAYPSPPLSRTRNNVYSYLPNMFKRLFANSASAPCDDEDSLPVTERVSKSNSGQLWSSAGARKTR
jgi:hypothetical protein